MSSLSGSLPSRSLFGAVANYYGRSFQYSIVQKRFLGRSFPLTLAFQKSLWNCVLPVSSLTGTLPSRSFFGTVVNYYRRSLRYSIVHQLFLGRSSTYASLPEVSLELRPPREFSLGFVAIEVSLRHCSELLLEVSPVFDRAEDIFGEISPTYASLPEVSLEMCPPREFSLGFVTIEVSLWRCSELPPEVSPVFDRT